MAELVDAVDSKSTVERHIGSSPIEGTIHLVLKNHYIGKSVCNSEIQFMVVFLNRTIYYHNYTNNNLTNI